MSKIAGARRQGGSLGASDIAATLGLLAVAFMVDRVAPTKDAKAGLQPKESGHASPAKLVAKAKAGTAGATRHLHPTSLRKDGRTSFGASTAT